MLQALAHIPYLDNETDKKNPEKESHKKSIKMRLIKMIHKNKTHKKSTKLNKQNCSTKMRLTKNTQKLDTQKWSTKLDS